MSKRRVVVTGLGMLSPVGNTVESTWKALLAGQSGISLIDHFDTSAYATKFAGLVKDFNCDDIISRKEQRKMDAFIQYGIVAGVQAMQDSGLEVTEENATRIGAAIGSGIGGLGLIEENHSSLVNGGPRKISPFFVPSTIVNMVAGHLTIMFGLRGPSISIATACTSGVHNIGQAARIIAYGDADAMVAGGAEKASTPLGVGGFGAARALSTRNDNPQAASRPWDKDRDGFVLGDGAGMVVLEEYEHAKKTRRQNLRRDRWLRHEQRCLPHDVTAGRWRGRRAGNGECYSRCGHRTRPDRLRQRPRHLDAGRR